MIHHLYTHDWAPWRSRVQKINGAWTYSVDIVKHYVPHIAATLKAEGIEGPIVVSTCGLLHKYGNTDVMQHTGKWAAVVQFLHTWPRQNALAVIYDIHRKFSSKAEHVIVVCAYHDYAQQINNAFKTTNLSARFLPMRIGPMPEIKPKGRKKRQAVWFGNLYSSKKQTHERVKAECEKHKIELITIADGKIYDYYTPKGRSIAQRNAWQMCANAGLVFAVGRCALEAYALGCRVIVAGDEFGGTVEGRGDWQWQEWTNFNSRKTTGSVSIADAVQHAITTTKKPYICQDRIFCTDMVQNGIIKWTQPK